MPDETVPLSPMGDTGADTGEIQLYDKPEDEKILYAAYRSNIQDLNNLIKEEPGSAWRSYHPSEDTLLHRIASGGYPTCLEAAKLILDNWKAFGINSQNLLRWTPLHNAAYMSQQIPLVELLLQRGADPTIANSDEENPFQLIVKCNSTVATKIADLLLSNNSKLIYSRSKTGENIVETILKHSALNMLEFLWTKFNNESDATFNSLLVDSGHEGPSMWLAVQKGDGPDTVKCVEFLLDILPAEAINAKGKDGNTALHVAAMRCSANVIKILVSNKKTNVFQPNGKGETCLHLLSQVSGVYLNPLECLETLFRESHQLKNDGGAKRRIILSTFLNTSSPLTLAVKNRTTKVAQFLIQEHGDKEAISKRSDGLLSEIYERTPEAVIPMLDKCITYIPSASEDDLDTITTDMGPITGYEGSDIRNESKLIHGIFNSPVKQQRKVLSHPVVSIFLIEKWKRLQPLTYVYIGAYAFWLLVYSFLCYELYPGHCPSNSTEVITDQTGIFDLRLFRSLGFQKRLETENCNFNSSMAKLFALILFVYTPLFIVQEVVKITVTHSRWNTYVFNPLIVLHWIRHIFTVINIVPAFMDPTSIPVWQYHLGVLLFVLSWLMLLNELANFRRIAIFYSIIIVTAKNYGQFLLCIGFPILVAFVPALSRYVAKQNQFLYLPFGIAKNFMLMTGEVEYKETFYGDDGPNLTSNDIIGQFIIVICVFGFGFVLANVLTSVAVKDYQDLVRDAEYKTAVMQLKSINFVDALIVWLNGFGVSSKLGQLLAKWNQLNFDGITRTIKNLKTDKFNEELKQLVKEIAIRETITLNSEGTKPVKKAFG